MSNACRRGCCNGSENEYKVIDLQYEYPGYIGDVRWAVVTELSRDELVKRYREKLGDKMPFIILSLNQGEVIADFKRNEDKFRKRRLKEDIFGYDDGYTERFHAELYAMDHWKMLEDLNERWLRESIMEDLPLLIKMLTEKQRTRLNAYYFDGKSAYCIADAENVSHTAILRSIHGALKKLKKLII